MTPSSVHRLSRDARRSVMVRLAINEIGRALVWTLSVAIGVVLADRVFLGVLPIAWWAVAVLAAMVGVVMGSMRAVRRAPSLLGSAGVLDDRLQLSSRLRSALELGANQDKQSAGFIELAMRDAQARSDGIDVRAARPDPQPRAWWVSLTLLLALIAVGLWAPLHSTGPNQPPAEPPMRALAGIDAASEITDELAERDDAPESVRQELDELEALRNELEQGVTDQDEADARTASQLEQLAQAMEDESQQARDRANALSESIDAARNQARAAQEQWDPRVEEFADSMREQRFDDAAEQIESLNDSLDSLSPDERERIAQQLEELANAIEPEPAPKSDAEPDPKVEQLADPVDPTTPSEPAADEETERSQDPQPQSQPEAESEPQPEQRDPEQSDDGSDPTDSDSESQSDSEPEPSPQRDLSESLREQAQQMRESPQQEASDGDQGERDGAQQDQQPPQQGQEPQPQPQQGEQAESQGNESSQEPQQQQESQEQSEQGGEQPEQNQGQQDTQGEQPAQQEAAEQNQEQQQQQGSERQGQEQQQTPQDQREGRQQGEQQNESLEERLRRMEQQQQRSQRDQQQSQRLREQAQRLMRPQDEQQPEPEQGEGRAMPESENDPQSRGAGDGERDPNTPELVPDDNQSQFVPVDARDQDATEGGQPVGKWYGPEGEPLDPGQSSQTAQRFRRASQQAQRAIDEQQVPRRYRHLVREVFERVKSRADSINDGGRIAPQGQDATPGSSNGSNTTNGSSGSGG